MTNLKTLRVLEESPRFARLRADDLPAGAPELDVGALAAELGASVRGEVRFDAGSRALYATDASNYRQAPIGVVIPRDAEDVVRTIAVARRHGAPVLSRGGGTSLAGQSCNAALLLDFSKYMHRVVDVDADRRVGRVQPGCVLDDLRAAAEPHGLTFGPDPATHDHCTLGGMLGNNSCGVHSLLCWKEGLGLRTSDNTMELEILTYDGLRMRVGETPPDELERIIAAGGRRGEIYASLRDLRDHYADEIRRRFPQLPRRVSGYNLDELLPEKGFNVARALVGTEGTCVTVLEATLRLVHHPPARALLVLGYPDIFAAGDHIPEILRYDPTALEGIDDRLFDWIRAKGDENANIALLPPGRGWLLVEFGGDSTADADAQARRCMEALNRESNPPSTRLYDDPAHEQMIWAVREGGLGSTAWVPGQPDTWPGWEDSAVPPERIGGYLREFRDLLDRYGYRPSLYGHFGQGCVHCRIDFDLYTRRGIEQYRAFVHEAAELVIRHGGSLSGEHGDGQSRAELLPMMFGDSLVAAMREFKRIWDPAWKMNPGKVIDPSPITEHLRISPDYNPPAPATYFAYPSDSGSFARGVLRCVGVGKCRRESGGVMCPSYMATREEKHSTRGRARLLWEMMNGEILTDGWRTDAVKEALDLCLSCKGCRRECPVNVDMATYKAEFLSHYYEHRLRPRSAYAFGLIHLWARAAGLAPAAANLATQVPGLRAAAKRIAGAAPDRELPAFAAQSFRRRFRRHTPRHPAGPPVLLWPDTFTNYFQPDVAQAAVEVLENAEFRVMLPTRDLCCGRPLYDYGFLGLARRWLQHTLRVLQPQIEAGIPMVVLEPSCAAVFRDEMLNLFPHRADAERLRNQTYLLSEFLRDKAPGYRTPRLERAALVQAHCHHRSVLGVESELALLEDLGLELQIPEPGCCGMAGAFGYEAGERYDVSIRCGERALLPAVRQADPNTLIVADGFSCREQISQGSGREALHVAQVLQLALHQARDGLETPPETSLVRARATAEQRARRRLALASGAAAGGVLAAGIAFRRLRNGKEHGNARQADRLG